MGPWSFIGRTDELSRLIKSATSGGRGLIYSGTAGIGKSRLLREGTATLPAERYALYSASANIATAGLPFGGLAQILPAEQPVGLSAAGLLRWAVDALRQQAAGRPMVLAIDDAHLLDPSSAALVYLIARTEQATVLGTLRSGDPVPLPIRALWTDDLVDHAELAPMTAEDTGCLLAEMLGGPVESSSVERLWRLSAGNALLLRELVIAASAQEMTQAFGVWRWHGSLELAPSLTDMIDTRIGQLSPPVRTVVELVALGEPIGLDLLIAATGSTEVETAEERGLIRVVADDRRNNVRLAHPLYGEVVRRRCPVTRARRLQARLADLVEGVGARRRDDLLRVAVWRLESGTARDPRLLLGAGVQAFGRFDVPLALRLARGALAAGGGFPAAELLATMLMFADAPEEALEVLDAVRDQTTSDQRLSRWLTARAMVSYWGLGRLGTVDEIAAEAASIGDPVARARVRSFEANMRLHRKDCAEALRLAQAVLDGDGATAGASGLARCTIGYLQAVRGDFTGSGRAIAAVEADAAQWRADMPYLQLSLELARGARLILAGDLAGIDAIAHDEFADLADAGDFRLGSGAMSILRSHAARLRGQTGEALRVSLQACAMLATSRVYGGGAHAARAHVAALRGDSELAVAAMADCDSTESGPMVILYPWREQARVWVTASTGDVAGAVQLLCALVDRLRTDGFTAHEASALHDLVRLGRPELAVDRLAALAGTVDGPLGPLFARHARAATDCDGAELLAVAEEFGRRELNMFGAEAAATALAGLRAARSPSAHEASMLLAELLERCDTIRTPALRSTQPTLTERERQVARLAAAGVPSRQIAEQLFLSPRTVENHLQRVYSKLGVTGRAELVPAMRALPD